MYVGNHYLLRNANIMPSKMCMSLLQIINVGISDNLNVVFLLFSFNSLTTEKQTTKFVCKFSKNIKSKLYYIENSKTRGQTL